MEWTTASESWISWSGFGEGRVVCATSNFGEEMIGLKGLSLFADFAEEVGLKSLSLFADFGEEMVGLKSLSLCADFGEEMAGLKSLSLFVDLADEVAALSCWISSVFGEGIVILSNGIAGLRD